jgi:hypothetical protein
LTAREGAQAAIAAGARNAAATGVAAGMTAARRAAQTRLSTVAVRKTSVTPPHGADAAVAAGHTAAARTLSETKSAVSLQRHVLASITMIVVRAAMAVVVPTATGHQSYRMATICCTAAGNAAAET